MGIDRTLASGLAALIIAGASLPVAAQTQTQTQTQTKTDPKAETCYRDDTGRIVKRRLPGTVEVPCPTERLSAPELRKYDSNGPTTTYLPQPPQAEPPGFNRGPPPEASPIPLPGLADYVESVPVPDRWRIVDAL